MKSAVNEPSRNVLLKQGIISNTLPRTVILQILRRNRKIKFKILANLSKVSFRNSFLVNSFC